VDPEKLLEAMLPVALTIAAIAIIFLPWA